MSRVVKKVAVGLLVGFATLIVLGEIGILCITLGHTEEFKIGDFTGNMTSTYPLYEKAEFKKYNPEIPILNLTSHFDLAIKFEETELDEIPKPNLLRENEQEPESFVREIEPSSFQGILVHDSLPKNFEVRNRIFYKELLFDPPIQYRWETRSFLANDKMFYQLDLSGADEIAGSFRVYGFLSKAKATRDFRAMLQENRRVQREGEIREVLQELTEGQHDKNFGTYQHDLEELSHPPTEDEKYLLRDLVREGKLNELQELFVKKPEILGWRTGIARDLPLHNAAFHGQLTISEWLLAQGAELEEVNIFRETALHSAVRSRKNEGSAKYLLAEGANVEARNREGRTPLHNAAIYGNLVTTRLLLEAGADHSPVDLEGMTPLAIALKDEESEIAELLIKSGAAPEQD